MPDGRYYIFPVSSATLLMQLRGYVKNILIDAIRGTDAEDPDDWSITLDGQGLNHKATLGHYRVQPYEVLAFVRGPVRCLPVEDPDSDEDFTDALNDLKVLEVQVHIEHPIAGSQSFTFTGATTIGVVHQAAEMVLLGSLSGSEIEGVYVSEHSSLAINRGVMASYLSLAEYGVQPEALLSIVQHSGLDDSDVTQATSAEHCWSKEDTTGTSSLSKGNDG